MMAKEVFQRTKPHVNVGSSAHVSTSLRNMGLSTLGIQQALRGIIVSDPQDRAVIARMLTVLASVPRSVAEIYDFPGEYAQRFDDVAED
jgi:hypothetical protein